MQRLRLLVPWRISLSLVGWLQEQYLISLVAATNFPFPSSAHYLQFRTVVAEAGNRLADAQSVFNSPRCCAGVFFQTTLKCVFFSF